MRDEAKSDDEKSTTNLYYQCKLLAHMKLKVFLFNFCGVLTSIFLIITDFMNIFFL